MLSKNNNSISNIKGFISVYVKDVSSENATIILNKE